MSADAAARGAPFKNSNYCRGGARAVQVPPSGLVGTDADGSWVPMAVAAMAESGRLPHAAPAPSTEGLPRAFLQSLRTLFDILDDRQRGYVHLREIESRWQGADARELPCGVLEGLRQVAPANGYLTFERFVAGLRTSLLNANGRPRDQARVAARSGDQPLLQQRLMFVPADEPRTVLEKKPLPPSARPAPAGPSSTSRNPELPCVPAEAAPSPEEPKRPPNKALERSPSADAGAAACKTLDTGKGEARQTPRARGERRRHTITNGVDCGLDFGTAGSPLPLGRLLPKVQEVARCLGELLTAACSGRAPPSSSVGPLGPTSPSTPVWQQQTILMLKEQNRLLTQEVTDKSERITQLEQEKSALIKQLFEARALSQQDAGPLDSTFI
ncbi:suppressor APC domain-containing protein 2 isoform X2 [Peromyscus leucopus]|uniref:suppressor APC domain-containing protein 2 isoform X2 n=1 Tax=Peromyscus leucopus TaxID=10041 RepID=UPI001885741A|nr:suppressor APC domain-containing protein 2 isoform X2 [Peromyscus leucopus]